MSSLYPLRSVLVDHQTRSVRLARFDGTLQSSDGYTIVNCGGIGRLRRYERYLMHLRDSEDQPPKPLLRGHSPVDVLWTQVFQLAGCNWRCWYCFVDDALLRADVRRSEMVSVAQMIDFFLSEMSPATVIDLSGGQPDIVPEWALWTMQEMASRDLQGQYFLWVDDNLGTDLLWETCSDDQIGFMANFPNHSRVGCFKGFDEESFSFNTGAPGVEFERQFTRFSRLLDAGFDMYAYVTFTDARGAGLQDLDTRIDEFIDRLRSIHINLPLRTIPLKISTFGAMRGRMIDLHDFAIQSQHRVGQAWRRAMKLRYGTGAISLPYDKTPLTRNDCDL